MAAKRNYSGNSVATTISAALSNSAASFSVAALTNFPAAPFTGILDKGTASEEVVTVTGVSGTTLTVTRGVDGTAKAHNSGASFAHGVSAVDFNILASGGGSDDVAIMSLMSVY